MNFSYKYPRTAVGELRENTYLFFRIDDFSLKVEAETVANGRETQSRQLGVWFAF